MARTLRVRDLPSSPGPRVVLLCQECRRTWSACRGDYFMRPPDDELTCDCQCECERIEHQACLVPDHHTPLVLRKEVTRYVRV